MELIVIIIIMLFAFIPIIYRVNKRIYEIEKRIELITENLDNDNRLRALDHYKKQA